jgi:serine/threonine-protein kinase RsbT
MRSVERRLLSILASHVSPITANSVLTLGRTRANVDLGRLDGESAKRLALCIERGLTMFVSSSERRTQCMRAIEEALRSATEASLRPEPSKERMIVPVLAEDDIVTARSVGRNMVRALGFSSVMQVKVATAISELARNIVHYAGTGEIALSTIAGPPPGIEVVARDNGPGIANLDHVLSGNYTSKRGMGMGLRGTRNLADSFGVKTGPTTGTQVTIRVFAK